MGACGLPFQGTYETGPVRSVHVPMRDGVRIALDVVLPDGLAEGQRVPTILTMTRYWRSWEGDGPNDLQRFLTRHGYGGCCWPGLTLLIRVVPDRRLT